MVTNVVLAEHVGRTGGVGWAVRQVSECFRYDSDLGVDVAVLMGERPANDGDPVPRLHGASVVWPLGSWHSQFDRVRRERIGLFLSIDYRSGYQRFFYACPRVPIIVLVR